MDQLFIIISDISLDVVVTKVYCVDKLCRSNRISWKTRTTLSGLMLGLSFFKAYLQKLTKKTKKEKNILFLIFSLPTSPSTGSVSAR